MLLVYRQSAIGLVDMDSRGGLLICLFFVLSCGVLVLGEEGHGSLCRPNERFLSCGGCQKTCTDPAPQCLAVCRTGCYCNDDEVRNETGHCVKLADCPSMQSAALHSSEPRHSDSDCPADEEWRSCEPCNRTCENPNPICPAQCSRGCFCRDNLVRDSDGRCVKVENCSIWKKNESLNYVQPIAYQLTCEAHQYYSSCKFCEKTCSAPEAVCTNPCSAGCFCKEGYLKAPSGKCVQLEDCPKAEVTLGGAHEPSIEDCSPDEIYLSCGWCEPTCTEPKPQCPHGVCTRGCLCRPPLLRHHSGHCVSEDNCRPQKCIDPNEEFVCRYGCEARCDALKCMARPRLCVLGCHCRLGLLRDVNGKCVAQQNCLAFRRNHTKSNDSNADPSGKIDKVSKSAKLESVFDVPAITDEKPSQELISRAVKLYKELLSSPLGMKESYVPRNFKELSEKEIGRTEHLFRSGNGPIVPLFSGPFFTMPDDDNVKNHMRDLLSVVKDVVPPAENMTWADIPVNTP